VNFSACVLYHVVAGFGDRLLAEVKKLTPKDIKIRVSYQFGLCTVVCSVYSSALSYGLYCIYLGKFIIFVDISTSRSALFHMDGVSFLCCYRRMSVCAGREGFHVIDEYSNHSLACMARYLSIKKAPNHSFSMQH
jgi:hypothetical protein